MKRRDRDLETIDSLLNDTYAMPSDVVDEVLDDDSDGVYDEEPALNPLRPATLYESIIDMLTRIAARESGVQIASRTRTALYERQQARIDEREAFRDKIISRFHRCVDSRFATMTTRTDLDAEYVSVREIIERDHPWILERAGETVERFPCATYLRVRIPGMTHWYAPDALLQLISRLDPRDPDDVRDLERAARAAL